MAKKKASLKGKGQSILLGEEEAPEPLPQSLSELERTSGANGDGSSAETEPEEEEKVDWAAMLEDEATAAEPPEEESAVPPLPTIEHYYAKEPPAEPEPPAIEEPVMEEPFPAPVSSVAPPRPVVAEPEPEIEMPLEAGEGAPEIDWMPMMEDEVATAGLPAEEAPLPLIEHYYPAEEPALPESELPAVEKAVVSPPLPTAVPEPLPPAAVAQPPPAGPTSLPRMRIGGLLSGTPLAAKVEPPGPVLEKVQVRDTDRLPPKELEAEEEEIVVKRVSQKRRRELFEHISELYHEVPGKLSASRQEAKREVSLLLLSEARDIVIEEPRQFDQAEYKVAQVEAIIANAQDIEKWSHYYGNRLIIYLVTWFAVLMAGVVIIHIGALSVWLGRITSTATEGITPTAIEPLLFTMLWGGIGGIVGGLYSLWRHIAVFDKQYTIWYTLQPISGIILGGIIHVVTMTGFLSMSVQSVEAGATTGQVSLAVQWFPALMAVAFGFRQNNFYALLDRIIELIGQPREDEEQAEASA